ncbi:MAG: hypothetical protein ACRDLD_02215 [Thermoleophilaceae bacterium]
MGLLENPASTITTGRKVVATAGTPGVLSGNVGRIISVTIQAESDNTGVIAIGDANVDAAVGAERGVLLEAGQAITLNIAQLSTIFCDATVSGDGVSFLALGM